MKNLEWRKYNGEKISNINEYVLNYINTVDNNTKIVVGCDSDSHSHRTKYAISIGFYNEELKKGVHIIYATSTEAKVKDLVTKLWKEVNYSYEVAESLNKTLEDINYHYDFKRNYHDGSKPTKLVEIHVDLNPHKSTRNGAKLSDNKSNKAYNDIMGWLCSDNYKVCGKPYSYMSSSASDKYCK